MLSVSAAVAELRKTATILAGRESCALHRCLGRVLAADIHAPLDVPPADNSAMDGYALRYADWRSADLEIPLSQRIVAGSSPAALEEGTAARIFTGAEIPAGADTVVMQENCEATEAGVRIQRLPPPGANVRPRAQDIRSGQPVYEAGRRLRAQDLGLIASLGIAEVDVYQRLKVAIISNGDELVEPGLELQPGQIYNSNRYTLRGLVEDWGFESLDLGIAPDEPLRIGEILSEAADGADVIISAGGVSVGEEDHIRDVVASMGAIDLWKVAIKPGKPLAFGRVGDTPFIGLPGNPSSVLVTCLVIARPYLFDCQGISGAEVSPLRKQALFDAKSDSRQEYLRARTTAKGVECFPKQSSGILLSTTWGDGLVVRYPGQDISGGDMVDFLPYTLLR